MLIAGRFDFLKILVVFYSGTKEVSNTCGRPAPWTMMNGPFSLKSPVVTGPALSNGLCHRTVFLWLSLNCQMPLIRSLFRDRVPSISGIICVGRFIPQSQIIELSQEIIGPYLRATEAILQRLNALEDSKGNKHDKSRFTR